MSDPSTFGRTQLVLAITLGAALLALLGLIAEALGFLKFRSPADSDESTAVLGSASPSEIITTGEAPESGPPPTPVETATPTAELGDTWNALYRDQVLYLDSLFAGTDACAALQFDLDGLDAGDTIKSATASNPLDPGDVDLVWDPCTGYDLNEVYLLSGENSLGSIWVEGTVLDAAACYDDLEQYPLALSKTVDPAAPYESWVREGQLLCMVTSESQVVLANITTVEPSTEAYDGMQVMFEVDLWSRA